MQLNKEYIITTPAAIHFGKAIAFPTTHTVVFSVKRTEYHDGTYVNRNKQPLEYAIDIRDDSIAVTYLG